MFQINLNTDNDAFTDPTREVARILRALADRLEGASPGEDYPLRDINGNKVGQAVFKDNQS